LYILLLIFNFTTSNNNTTSADERHANGMKTIQGVINYTNLEIQRWYDDVFEQYGVVGSGIARYDKDSNSIIVDYVEDGILKTWQMAFYPEYLNQEKISWVFECWSELA
jgi:hypothetical protein